MLTSAREPCMSLLSKIKYSETLVPGVREATLQSHYKYYRGMYTIYDSKMSTKLNVRKI
jgi:hypothetical protein